MRKPKIKEVHGILYLPEHIRIGSGYTYASEIVDPGNKYSHLFKMLNGEYTTEMIVSEVSGILTEEEVLNSIEMLNEEGYLEDAAETPPSVFSDEELERYRVNLNFFNTISDKNTSKYSYQEKLKNSHIVLFGMGGIGSNICFALAELGIGKITAVDFDVIESSNLNRQVLYDTPNIGRLKTEVAKERINNFNPEIVFKAIHKEITSPDDVRKVLDDNPCDVAINVADYPSGYIDFWVNEACVERNIPIFAAVVQKKFGRVYSVFPGETACYNCQVLQETQNSKTIAEEFKYMQDTSFRTPGAVLGPTCMFHAYFISYEILRYLLNLAPILTKNKLFEIDFLTFEHEYYPLYKRDDCTICNNLMVNKN